MECTKNQVIQETIASCVLSFPAGIASKDVINTTEPNGSGDRIGENRIEHHGERWWEPQCQHPNHQMGQKM